MAIQFPNFLGVPVRTPDYSGLGDAVSNYYAGRAMPKDDLIKAVQAEFARPTAQQALIGAQLENRKRQMAISQLAREMANQAAFDKLLKGALSGTGTRAPAGVAMPTQQPAAMMPDQQAQAAMPTQQTSAMPLDATTVATMPVQEPTLLSRINPQFRDLLGSALQPVSQEQAPAQQPAPQVAAPVQTPVATSPATGASTPPTTAEQPQQTQTLPPQVTQTVLSQGSPHLYGIDALWDSRPDIRPYLEKRGFKKTEKPTFDKATGKSILTTTYPSGRIVVTTSSMQSDEGIPLTKAMITKHQNVIAGVDNVIPVLEEILKLGGGEKLDENGMPAGKNKDVFQPYPRSAGGHWYTIGMGQVPGWMSDATNYESLVTSAAEPLVKALGYPMTNEGIEKAVQQVASGHGERNYRYIQRIRALIKELQSRKEYSQKEVKRSNKIQPISRMAGGEGNQDFSDLGDHDPGEGV